MGHGSGARRCWGHRKPCEAGGAKRSLRSDRSSSGAEMASERPWAAAGANRSFACEYYGQGSQAANQDHVSVSLTSARSGGSSPRACGGLQAGWRSCRRCSNVDATWAFRDLDLGATPVR